MDWPVWVRDPSCCGAGTPGLTAPLGPKRVRGPLEKKRRLEKAIGKVLPPKRAFLKWSLLNLLLGMESLGHGLSWTL